jgi:hypothetical protein
MSAAEMSHKQAVVETSLGTFIIDLRPELAPNHVGYFMKARASRGRTTEPRSIASLRSPSSRGAIR